METRPWLRTMKARALVRLWSIFGEPLWVVVNMGFPVLSSLAFSLLYLSIGAGSYVGFAVLGGVMVSFWGNVLWSMASQFNWDKQEGLFEIYLTSPAPISAILIGMSVGGILATVPSAVIVTLLGWALFHPAVSASWGAVVLTFGLTLASLYALGMTLSSLYLVYGREAESMNNVIQEPVSMLSGVYFPSIGAFSPFPFALQVAASLIPLTIGMDALRKSLFFARGIGAVWLDLVLLAVMAVVFLGISEFSLRALERKGRRDGTIAVRIR
ncbi:MAG TPA: ABC transporter permease [Nitrososphaerales archaeon]|nr:ABC transporter permease [Nitrososphaerales archaeon]